MSIGFIKVYLVAYLLLTIPTISMMTVIIGAVTNIILDPIFIFGFNMGVQGAAVATVLSQALSAVWALKFLCGKNTILRIRRKI